MYTASRARRTGRPSHLHDTPDDAVRAWPVYVGVLGTFLLLKAGSHVELRAGGKVELLLSELALRSRYGAPREELLALLWPDSDTAMAGHSLNALVSTLHRQFGDVLGGDGPVVRAAGNYALNLDGGVGLDLATFEAAADEADAALRSGDLEHAKAAYRTAAGTYRGDLCVARDVRHVVDRERLRMRYLAVLSSHADCHFGEGDYCAARDRALELLAHDPCREDAHRLVIRCHVRLGQRAQALRQYRLCASILRTEFDVEPEVETTVLYDQVRLDPAAV